MNSPTRRAFLGTAATSLGLPLPGNRAVAGLGPAWIDSHVHVWTDEWATYPISRNFLDHEPAPATFLPRELLAVQEGTGVTRTVLVQMSFYEFDNSYMLDVMREFPGRFGGIGIVDSSLKNVAQQMRTQAGRGVRGFRLYAFPDRTAKWKDDKGNATMWRTGAEENLAMCCLTDPKSLADIRAMCERFPETPVVIDHFARIGMTGEIVESDLEQLLGLADFPKVHVKVSAYYALGKKAAPYTDLLPMIRRVRDAFGSERMMWGSDAPFQVQDPHTYAASLALITEHCDFLSEEEKSNVLRNTAETLFF